MKETKEPLFSKKTKRISRGFNLAVLVIAAVVLVACVVLYTYWPKEYRTEYFLIVVLLFLNIIFFYSFVRHNKRHGKRH